LGRGLLTRPWQTEPSTSRAGTDEMSKVLYTRTQEADRKVVEEVGRIAEAKGIPRAQVALAWVLRNPVVVAPIVGATKPHHLEDAVRALSVRLTDEEAAALEAPYIPHPVAGHV
jgi:aryl-alcohol dehydrogenase-like predicted oxidoreductase